MGINIKNEVVRNATLRSQLRYEARVSHPICLSLDDFLDNRLPYLCSCSLFVCVSALFLVDFQ